MRRTHGTGSEWVSRLSSGLSNPAQGNCSSYLKVINVKMCTNKSFRGAVTSTLALIVLRKIHIQEFIQWI
jgi:hypothetical protein